MATQITLRPQPITTAATVAAPAHTDEVGEIRRVHARATAEAVNTLPQERAAIYIAATMTAAMTHLIEAGVDPLVVSREMAAWKEDLRTSLINLRLGRGSAVRLH